MIILLYKSTYVRYVDFYSGLLEWFSNDNNIS